MKKKNRNTAYIFIALILLLITIIPSFAYNPRNIIVTYVNTNVANTTNTFTMECNVTNVNYCEMIMTDSLNIYLGQENNTQLVFSMPVYRQQYFSVSIYASGDDGISGTIGYGDNMETYYSGSLTPDAQHQDININIVCYLPTFITAEELDSQNEASYQAGLQMVKDNPLLFGLVSEQDMLQYGRQEFSRGVQNGSEGEYQRGYEEGLERGHKDSATLKGVLNVGLSGLWTSFTEFVSNTGIFGISLISILVSGVIILIVFVIFKIVRS